MLADNELINELTSGKIFNLTNATISNFKVQPSSIDLTVKSIHLPDTNKVTRAHKIDPGETVILEVNEVFNLSKDISGIVFPKNNLSKNGIIMTNPGHVDPGYNGILTLYLVNMSKQTFILREKDAVARLLLFKTSSITSGYTGQAVTSIDQEQLNTMGKDFAGLDKRIPVAIAKVLAKWSVGLFAMAALIIAIVGFAVPISYTLTSSYLDNSRDLKVSIDKQKEIIDKQSERIDQLNKEITILNSRATSQSATIPKRAAK
ncbi:dCTP deaminase [Pantoea ananatis]|jgi:deoxycytidine triphosphate deaminase|uniref:dCTP deaminase n=1 Tax=Pantoea ananas TaxID=553 RepID=UPI00059D632C|nr:hypothetical protein [Pantoea ananatis]UEG18721.1 hypothetical protein LLG94_04650 [Pantoea ananatis]